MQTRILKAIRAMGDASTGQIAAYIGESTEEVRQELSLLLAEGRVSILPYSLTWTAEE